MDITSRFWNKQIQLDNFRDAFYIAMSKENEKLLAFLEVCHIYPDENTLYIILKDSDEKFMKKVIEADQDIILKVAQKIHFNLKDIVVNEPPNEKYVFVSSKYDILKIRWSNGGYHDFRVTLDDLWEIASNKFEIN